MTLLLLWACGPVDPPGATRPDGLPMDALEIALSEDGVVVRRGEQALGTVPHEAFRVDPVDAVQADLQALLDGAPAVWIHLPDETPWYLARKLLGSAQAAGVADPWLGDAHGAPLHATAQHPISLKMRCKEPLAWTGVQPRVTVALQRNQEAHWMRATASFLPVVGGQPTDGLPAECLAPRSCGDLAPTPELRGVCEAARGTAPPRRVELGGDVGCMLPLVTQQADALAWSTQLPQVARQLGLDASVPVVLSPEASIPWALVMTTLRGFHDAGLPLPALGQPLIEGNDGPPICDATVRDRRALDEAAARVAGSWSKEE